MEIEFHRQISRLTFKIRNIHHSTKINYNCRTLIEDFIPELKEKFEIDEVQVTQEQNAPVAMTLSNLLMVGNFTFLAINLKLLSRSVTIRLQVDKSRTFTHATLLSHVSMLTLKDYCASLKNERLKTENCEKKCSNLSQRFFGTKRGIFSCRTCC